MKHLCLLTALSISVGVLSQTLRQPLSSAFARTACYSNTFVDVFSGTGNQAAFVKLKGSAFGVAAERRFFQSDLNQFTAVAAVPLQQGVLAFQGDYFGNSSYSESQLGVGYARKIASAVDVGAKLNYYNLRLAGYGSAATVNFELAAIFQLTAQLNTGFHIYNPLQASLGKNGLEDLPSIYKAGFGYQSSEHLFIGANIVGEEGHPISVEAGLQYKLHDKLILRCGMSSLPLNYYGGIGLQTGVLRLDLTASYHQQLGVTPGILLSFNITKPKTE